MAEDRFAWLALHVVTLSVVNETKVRCVDSLAHDFGVRST